MEGVTLKELLHLARVAIMLWGWQTKCFVLFFTCNLKCIIVCNWPMLPCDIVNHLLTLLSLFFYCLVWGTQQLYTPVTSSSEVKRSLVIKFWGACTLPCILCNFILLLHCFIFYNLVLHCTTGWTTAHLLSTALISELYLDSGWTSIRC